jgi:hypothetical protein
VASFPPLELDYEAHIENNGEVLPHMFLVLDLMPTLVNAYLGDPEYQDVD